MSRLRPGRVAALSTTRLAALATLAALAGCPRPRPPVLELTTTAEASGWRRTGRHDEAVRLCRDLARSHPDRVRCLTYGQTSEGRPLVAVVASADGVLEPGTAAARRRPVIVVQAGIHAGEIEGKDAGFVLLRELMAGTIAPGALGAVTLVFVPVVNPDGHERWGANNRPNQRGPEEMGFRTTALNLNLNRDYVKADAPEMVALLTLLRTWDPVVYVDLHTTDGAKFQHDVAVLVGPVGDRGDGLERAAATLSDTLQRGLTARGHLPLPFYPAFEDDDEPLSGFRLGEPPARFSHAYAPIRNRLGILVETHSWRTYEERARASHDTVAELLVAATTEAGRWRAACDEADRKASQLGGAEVPIAFYADDAARTIDFQGYAYEQRPSEISGGRWIVYDESRPAVWQVPLRDHVVPVQTVTAPRGGYLVPAPYGGVVGRLLTVHGIRFTTLAAPVTAAGQVFRADAVKPQPSFEGRSPVKVTGAWQAETVALPAGSLWVPIDQPLARLVLQLFEPTAGDSLVSWGTFNAWFERKEYLEPYLAEAFARELLARDPAVKAEFEARLADPAFAGSPEARLAFFARKHPSWDDHKDRVPIVKTDVVPGEATPAR